MNAVRPKQKTAKLIASPLASAKETIGEITPGCRIVGVNKCQFSLLDLAVAVIDQVGSSELTVATWTPGKAEMDSVFQMLKMRKIASFRLLVDRSFPTRQPLYVQRLLDIAGPDSVRQTRTHAKFALIAAGDYRITIRTSMNFNRNRRLEQFDLDDDPVIYDFFQAMIDEVLTLVSPGLDVSGSEINTTFNLLHLGSAGAEKLPAKKEIRKSGFRLTGFRTGR